MATFVIIHGGWGGGWEWTSVARKLRERGHEVFTPTLTGLGDRSHLGDAKTGLSDHIDDVLAVLRCEDLRDVVLCGHSYGGMVVTGAADRAAERIGLLVYLDSMVPKDGQAVVDLVPGEVADAIRAVAKEQGDGLLPILPDLLPAEGILTDEVRTRYIERLVPQPTATITEPVRLLGAIDQLPRAYVHCTGYEDSLADPFVERARTEGWTIRELDTEHDLQLFDPNGTVAVLDGLVNARSTYQD